VPLSKYFQGEGEKVMASMKKSYGEEKGKDVFYGKVNKDKKKRTNLNYGTIESNLNCTETLWIVFVWKCEMLIHTGSRVA